MARDGGGFGLILVVGVAGSELALAGTVADELWRRPAAMVGEGGSWWTKWWRSLVVARGEASGSRD